MFVRSILLTLSLSALPLTAQTPDPVSSTGFETLPVNFSLVASGITLDGPTTVTDSLVTEGTVATLGAGYVFADGSLQRSANNNTGASANAGLYENRLVLMTPAMPFTEVCFKAGAVQSDVHSISESTQGGACVPGDLGWIIERDQREAETWANARVACLLVGMRLPEPFEWLYSCTNGPSFGMIDMTNDWEWGSNTTTPGRPGTNAGAMVTILGQGGCGQADFNWAAGTVGSALFTYRCVR